MSAARTPGHSDFSESNQLHSAPAFGAYALLVSRRALIRRGWSGPKLVSFLQISAPRGVGFVLSPNPASGRRTESLSPRRKAFGDKALQFFEIRIFFLPATGPVSERRRGHDFQPHKISFCGTINFRAADSAPASVVITPDSRRLRR